MKFYKVMAVMWLRELGTNTNRFHWDRGFKRIIDEKLSKQ